ncbi:MAG: hypothetical protein P1U68_09560 [Verrucomicrobiales bacterium]|nr:hypothetical protein [Verrucomicrobiales bacterium]
MNPETPLRYQFAAERRGLLIVLTIAACTGALFTLPFQPPGILPACLWLGAATVFYYCVFRFFRRVQRTVFTCIPSKELFIAICFAAGIIVSIQSEFTSPLVFLHGFAMVLLFLGNCLTISRAEAEFDSQRDNSSFFSDKREGRALLIQAPAVIALGISLLLIGALNSPFSGGVIFTTSIANLLICQCIRIPARLTHALSDLALLIPPLIALLLRGILVR